MTNNLEVNMETLAIVVDGKEVDKANNKSELFVALYDEYQCTIAEIKSLTGCHYSFIFGVVSKKCEKRDIERPTGKADTIREMLNNGKTVSEISKELSTNYSYVYTVMKKWRSTHEDYIPTEAPTMVEEKEVSVPLTPFEQAALTEEQEEKPRTKKEIILDLAEQDVSPEQIAEIAQTTVKYVKNTIKAAQ